MSWTDGFFNAVNDDRVYTAEQISTMFEGLITNGVYESVGDKLAVQPNSEMTIQIATGRGWFGGKWVKNDSPYLITLDNSDVTLNRYAAVCVRVDSTSEVRRAYPHIKYSDFASSPIKPTPERTETVNEYILAYVYIPAGATKITASQIEDTRSNTGFCGWVTGLIKQISSTTLFTQFESLFFDWLNSLENYLDDNVEAKLTNDMLKLQNTVPKKIKIVFDGLGWDSQPDGTYEQTVEAIGVTPSNDIMITPTNAFKTSYIEQGIEVKQQLNDAIIFTCENPQNVDINCRLIIFDNSDVDFLPDRDFGEIEIEE